MSRLRVPLLLLLLTIVATANAAVVFDFKGERSGTPPVYFTGRGFIEKDSSRIDYLDSNHQALRRDVSIASNDRGHILTVMDHSSGTYFKRHTKAMIGILSAFGAPGQQNAQNPQIDIRKIATEQLLGQRADRYHLTIRYDVRMNIEGSELSAKVEAEAELWMGPTFRTNALPFGHQFALKTGFESVDEEIAAALEGRGLMLKQTVRVARTIEGGQPTVETSSTEVTQLKTTVLPAAAFFNAPAGYRYDEPRFAKPELQTAEEAPQAIEEQPAPQPATPVIAAPAEQPRLPVYVETMDVRVLNIDVVVTDKRGQPVSGLTANDFELLENGQPIEISNFIEISEGTLRAEKTAQLQPAAAATDHRRRQIVLFLDENTLTPLNRSRVIGAMKGFVAEVMRPGDATMIASYDRRGLRVELQLTPEKDVVVATLEKIENRSSPDGITYAQERERTQRELLDFVADFTRRDDPGRPPYAMGMAEVKRYAESRSRDVQRTIASLEALMQALGAIDGRKVLVLFTETLPRHPGREMFAFFDGVKQEYAGSYGLSPYSEAARYDATAALERLTRTANASGFAVYPIHARGAPSGGGAEESGSAAFVYDHSKANYTVLDTDSSALQSLADGTGGRALLNSSNFELALDSLQADLQNYYSIGYRAGDAKSDRTRQIEVKPRRPDVVVRARREQVETTVETDVERLVAANLFYPIERNELGISAKLDGTTLAVDIPTSTLTLLPDGSDLVGTFTIFAGFIQKDGSVSKIARRESTVRFPASTLSRRKSITVKVDVTMDPETSRVSVAALDTTSKAAGFASAFVAQ